ncbi:Ferric uptake regulation protein FUR [Dehalobacter sp. UNSWDHB]|uniref:Fur family transcriptional regulator n=1 Tax=Dehalobacter sp. UNSWDHB TaxID=1339256 RepID=UPI00038DA667|nr:transcriptional repressor [Dehalobacter sp. UNSWDHB]EQB20814.1 Ferric uptake regulation protein FUR [Dehalobacter sp. UNSWDHB]
MTVKELNQLLKEKGYKFTSQRQYVFEVVTENQGKHLNSQEIFELVRNRFPEIGVATVYRTLSLLEAMGLIYGVDFEDGFRRYDIVKDDEEHRHHHLICLECGAIKEVEEDLLGTIEETIMKKNKFKVINHRVKFYGYCEKCQAKIERDQ